VLTQTHIKLNDAILVARPSRLCTQIPNMGQSFFKENKICPGKSMWVKVDSGTILDFVPISEKL